MLGAQREASAIAAFPGLHLGLDDHAAHVAGVLERVAVEEDEIGILANLGRADLVVDAKDARGAEGHGFEGLSPCPLAVAMAASHRSTRVLGAWRSKPVWMANGMPASASRAAVSHDPLRTRLSGG